MTASSAESLGVNGAATPTQLFVINLAASTSPMALSHPSSPELKRFTFFVSRQREDGRERFRLHMGYFDTQEDAEQLLESVRDIYPAAWAGPAPTTGMGRRGRIAPGSVATGSAPPALAVAPLAVAPAPVAVPAVAAVPVVAAPAPLVAVPVPAPAAVAPAKPVAPAVTPPAVNATDATLLAPTLRAPVLQAPTEVPDLKLESMSNVRDVLAQLSEAPASDATVQMPLPPALKQQAPAPVAPKAAAPAVKTRPVARPAVPAARAPELTGADALSLLEMPPAPAAPPVLSSVATTTRAPVLPPLANPFAGLENEPEVRLVTPEDTQTLVDIKVDKENNAPPCFAVQLYWSISPIDVGTLPHLAIFDAYTLYNVEGNRQGRKWYGLRLGFFSDPNSATQVANYVRSDYKAVAVVPVAVKERDRARGGNAAGAPLVPTPRKTTDTEFSREGMEGFELLSDDRPAPAKRDLEDAGGRKAAPGAANGAARVAPRVAATAARPAAAAPRVAGAPLPGTATGKPMGKRVVARRRAPQPPPGKTVSAGVGGAEVLESTLEILGASTLSLDEGRQLITDAAARKPEARKSAGAFSRLLSRLSGG